MCIKGFNASKRLSNFIRAHNSVGRAYGLHPQGRAFDPLEQAIAERLETKGFQVFFCMSQRRLPDEAARKSARIGKKAEKTHHDTPDTCAMPVDAITGGVKMVTVARRPF